MTNGIGNGPHDRPKNPDEDKTRPPGRQTGDNEGTTSTQCEAGQPQPEEKPAAAAGR